MKKPIFKNSLYFLIKSLSYISIVIKTNFLIFLVLKDKNSSFFPRRTPQGFSLFTFFRCFIFHLSQVFSVFTFLGCFHFSLFSGVSFFTFFGSFSVAVPRLLRIWESLFYSQAFFLLHSFPTFDTTCFYQGFSGSRQFFPTHLFVLITQFSAKGITRQVLFMC